MLGLHLSVFCVRGVQSSPKAVLVISALEGKNREAQVGLLVSDRARGLLPFSMVIRRGKQHMRLHDCKGLR